jgi:methanogenic corrinoid protein MtbC1
MSEGRHPEPDEHAAGPEAEPGPATAAAAATGYNTHAVERMTGVPATTFRAWERRYGVPTPRRLPGGRRLYDERDVAVVRWLREQTESGLSVSLAVAQLRQTPAAPESAGRGTFPPQELAAALIAGAREFDAAAIDRTLSNALAAHPLETVCLEVVQPALVELGECWHRGEISPAVEHFATALVRRRLEQLAGILDGAVGRPLVVLGTAPQERHEIGVLIVSLLLRRRGLRVVYLGADVSVEAALEVIRQLRPDAFCLSASTPESAQTLGTVADAVAVLEGDRPRFGFGGRAFLEHPALAAAVNGTYLGDDARQAIAGVERLLRRDASGTGGAADARGAAGGGGPA